MRRTVTKFASESVGLCPFCGSQVREFELSHSNLVSRIVKITHAHNFKGVARGGPGVPVTLPW